MIREILARLSFDIQRIAVLHGAQKFQQSLS